MFYVSELDAVIEMFDCVFLSGTLAVYVGDDACLCADGCYLHGARFSHTLVGHTRRTAVFDISMMNLCGFAFA